MVIGVTNAEAAAWVAEGNGFDTHGAQTDADAGRADRVGQADPRVQPPPCHHVSSVDPPSIQVCRSGAARLPASGRRETATRGQALGEILDAAYLGETPASKRASTLLARGTAGRHPRPRCQLRVSGEGVDVPALDGIAFIDPKGSVVDIIQAVGRVIRLSADKTIGTIDLQCSIDESDNADNALEVRRFTPCGRC